jgi:hypothetical protein
MVMAIKEEIRDQIIAGIPVGRLGKPDEIAALVTYLASEDAGFITGANVAINGGQQHVLRFPAVGERATLRSLFRFRIRHLDDTGCRPALTRATISGLPRPSAAPFCPPAFMIELLLKKIFGSRNERLLKQYRAHGGARSTRWSRSMRGARRRRAAGQDRRVPRSAWPPGTPSTHCCRRPSRWCARPRKRVMEHAPLRRAADRRHGAARRQASPRCAPARARR